MPTRMSLPVLRQISRWRRSGLRLMDRVRLCWLPRYVSTTVHLFGRPLVIVDSASFLVGLDEIFENQTYDFPARTATPFILDCGANIGLATIFFKRRFPKCRIVSFEPDPGIFAALQRNQRAFRLDDVELRNAAVWTSDGTMPFWTEGGASGRLADGGLAGSVMTVPTVRLRDTIDRHVDLLKLDIEGAEGEVLEDCADRLADVGRIFVEYHSRIDLPQTLHRTLEILHRAGFRYHITEGLCSRHPFLSRPNSFGMDLQLNVFAFRD
jgi:FkbM family methyltransferase